MTKEYAQELRESNLVLKEMLEASKHLTKDDPEYSMRELIKKAYDAINDALIISGHNCICCKDGLAVGLTTGVKTDSVDNADSTDADIY